MGTGTGRERREGQEKPNPNVGTRADGSARSLEIGYPTVENILPRCECTQKSAVRLAFSTRQRKCVFDGTVQCLAIGWICGECTCCGADALAFSPTSR